MTELDALFDAAAAHYRDGRAEEAVATCRDILRRSPDHARALHLLGVIRAARGEADTGLQLIRQALAAKSDYAEAHFNLAAILAATGQPAEAAKHYAEVGRLKPDDVVAHIRHGALLAVAGQTDQALEQYRGVVARWPDCVPALAGLAELLQTRGHLNESIELHERAARLAPDSAEIALGFGGALKQSGRRAEGIAEYRRALALQPNQPGALNLLAVALFEEGALGEAKAVIARACAAYPRNATAHFNAALIAQATGDLATAQASLCRATELDPGNILYRRVSTATALYDPDIDEAARADTHRAFGSRATTTAAPLPPPPNFPNPARRLRVGWLSSDFRDHPVARNIEPLFACYDRSSFDMRLYGEIAIPDETTRRLQSHAGHWCSIVGQSDREVAERVRSDGIDILIFLAGRFDRNRPEIAAWRPAPIQVSLHDPGTSGLATMDYLIADRRLAPRNGEEWFSERVLALPTFYLHPPIAATPRSGVLPMSRGGGVTFGSFNHPAKMNDHVLRLWARLLREVHGSRLVLKYRGYFSEEPLRTRVRRAATEAGIDAERFVLAGERETLDMHLARYAEIDIALDTFPFSGSTTTFEALWMGVPVVTLPGRNMASRWSAAMLGALGRNAWIADSAEAYIRIASGLARDAAGLAEIRAGLQARMMRSNLCDTVRRTRQIERLMRAMWRHWCAARTSGVEVRSRR